MVARTVGRAWIAALTLVACSDYELVRPADKGGEGVDTAPGGDGGAPGDTASPAGEECNGEDDDGDGLVDEGYPDTDGDGVADCVDDDCEVEAVGVDGVDVDEDCVAPDVEVTDPWDVAIEWQWTGLAANSTVHNVIMTPVIGNLDDDDGDGDVDEDDVPDVVFVAFASTSFTSGTLVALDGATGAEKWTASGYHGAAGIALADVDGDGVTDILTFDSSGRPRAVDASGSVIWTASSAVSAGYPQATVADLDEDGSPEVIADDLVLDGATGAVLARLSVSSSYPYRLPAVGDLDQDGDQEIILAGSVFDAAGNLLWRSSLSGTYGFWAAILDYDGDPEAEVAMVAGGRLAIFEADGTVRVNVGAGTSQPGAPCVADFDGDGAAEIGWASSSIFNLYELDGTVVWSQSIDDSSGLAACSGYDVDGDGAYEVFYADQGTFYIFDGATGAVRYSQGGHASGTLWEYPAIADVDGDGSAEAVIASNNYWMSGWGGVTVFGHAGDGWQKSGTTWHTHDFAVTNILSDGTVPASPVPWWQVYNVYRARPTVDDAAIDLQAELVDWCASGCTGASPVQVEVRVLNTGGIDSDPGVPVALYAETGGARTLLATTTVPDPIPSGSTSEGIVFDLTLADVTADSLVVVADDDGTGAGIHTECDESNNEDALAVDLPCR